MSAPHTSEWPVTAGQIAEKTTDTQIIAAAEKTSNTDKTLATLIAQFALAGHAVHRGACGDYTVTRWGLCRYCPDLDALQAFAKQLGVAS